jgi:hypothetical protein
MGGHAVRHARGIFWDKQFWTVVGLAVLLVVNKVAGLGLSGADVLAIAGVLAGFVVADIQRDIAYNRKKDGDPGHGQ